MRSILWVALVLAVVGVLGGPAMAASIAINNPSFETLPAGGLTDRSGSWGGGNYNTNGVIPSWVANNNPNNGNIGQWQPTTSGTDHQFNSLPAGPTIAMIGPKGANISQTLATTIVAGMVYTLKVDIGDRIDGHYQEPTIELETASGVVLASGQVNPPVGGWATATATYLANSTYAGQQLQIVLVSAGSQGDFDNVRLDGSTSLPEPASMALIGLGLLGIGALKRRLGR